MNTHKTFADHADAFDTLNEEIARDHYADDLNRDLGNPANRLYDAGRFFQLPEAFENDCAFVARRAQVLCWAYNCLLLDQPAHVFNLTDLAGICLEVVGRDMRNMAAMAEEVGNGNAGGRADLECTTGELRVALEHLAKERGLKRRFSNLYREAMKKAGEGDQAETFIASSEREAAVEWGITESGIDALHEECAEEYGRRFAADRGVE